MADDDRREERLIEIPEDRPDFDAIADETETADPGDLPRALGMGDDESDRGRKRQRQSPVRGEVTFFSIEIPTTLYVLYSAWADRQEDMLRRQVEHEVPVEERLEPLPETHEEAFQRYLMEACGRDAEADDLRPDGEQQYNFVGFIGKGFRSLVRQYAAEEYEHGLRPQLREQRQLIKERLRDRLEEWSDEDLEELLGPTGEET